MSKIITLHMLSRYIWYFKIYHGFQNLPGNLLTYPPFATKAKLFES